mgnify:CR=1 FL=1
MRVLRRLFRLSTPQTTDPDSRLDAVTFYSALSFMALILVVTLPYRPF